MAVADGHVAESRVRGGAAAGAPRWLRVAVRVVVALLGFAVLVWAASALLGAPLRRELERRVNASLEGYTATVGGVRIRPLSLGLDLVDVTLVQNSQPDPPLVFLPRWSTTLQWRALLSGAIVADAAFERPAFYVTLAQAAREAEHPKAERGWQEAVTSITPLEINRLTIRDGSLHYFDPAAPAPVTLRRFSVDAENIRNVRSEAGRYPSPFALDATLPDGARLAFTGRADFLATPHATLRGHLRLDDLTLAQLAPALRHAGVEASGGRLALRGRIATTPTRTRLALDRLVLDAARIEYLVRKATADADAEKAGEAAKATTTAETQPATRVDVADVVVRDGTFGVTARESDPPYRLFVSGTEIRVAGFSNARAARAGTAELHGRVMNQAPLRVDARFAGGAARPDFRVTFRMEDLALPTVNDFLRAQAGLDVVGGRLSIYSEAAVKNGRVDGWVKPLFRDVDVYDRRQDREKSALQQAWQAVVGATSEVFTNQPRDQVATVTDLSGPVQDPSASVLETLSGLVRNAYVKAILPGLDPRR